MKWWTGLDDERFSSGPFETREEAVEQSIKDWSDGFWLIQAAQDPLRLSDTIDAMDVLENAEQHAWGEMSDPEGSEPITGDVTHEQIADLTARLRKVTDEWQDAHEIVFVSYRFTRSGDAEWIGPAKEDE